MRAARLPRARRPVRAHARWPRRRRDVRRAARSAPVRRPRRSGGGAAGASAPHSEARRPRSPASTGAGDEEPAARSAAAAGRLHCLSAAWPLPQTCTPDRTRKTGSPRRSRAGAGVVPGQSPQRRSRTPGPEELPLGNSGGRAGGECHADFPRGACGRPRPARSSQPLRRGTLCTAVCVRSARPPHREL
ncbi:zinc finger protein 664 isoform X2 [Pipistrellus kuhlii]|uniref:zinc finger protein 664 isoform X2 n=1 Tax=Pipistrellus kuhlii TaxID=59472 RepID=UPI001E26EF19|nr:zinc finger protein 664 isoform X2 [Pipistrellus kuhlii]